LYLYSHWSYAESLFPGQAQQGGGHRHGAAQGAAPRHPTSRAAIYRPYREESKFILFSCC
jgi:hypothetical protein